MDEITRYRRKTQTALRELHKAVERSAETDLRHGHYVEARRRALEIQEAAEDGVRIFDQRLTDLA